jgi:hypothetical protein
MAKPRKGYHDLFAQIPDGLWDALNADADANQRTATGQLIWILRQQYPDAPLGEPEAPPAEAKKRKGKK